MARESGRRAGISRNDVIQSAITLIDSAGLDQLTLARIATDLGVRTPTISHHIDSIVQLRKDLAMLAVLELSTRIGRVAIGKAGDDAVRAMFHEYRRFVKEHPGWYASSIQTPDPQDPRRLAAAKDLADVILSALGSYGLEGEMAYRANRLLRSAVHGYATFEVNQTWQIPLNDEASFDWILDTVIAGIRLQAAAQQPTTGE